MNEFEQRLRQVPVKPIPGEWRAEILAAAEAKQPSLERGVHAASTWQARITAILCSLFWPHPRAWAGLAAVWVVIAILHFSQPDDSPVLAEKSAPPSADTLADLRQQQQMLAELLGPYGAGEADRPKRSGPHTQLVRVMMG
jgi:hypothetical protein